jgi:hypothetical protein
MEYKKIYDQIIERAKNRSLEGYKEQHHILPKSLGGDNSSDNLVYLTAKEHFLCHRLLCEIYPNNPKLLYALWLMAIGKKRWKQNDPYNMSSKGYERLKLLFIENRKGSKISEEQKKKIGEKNSKKVIQYDFSGNKIAEFSSAAEAERSINNKPNSNWKNLKNNIDACCRLKQKSAYGFIWKYEGDVLSLDQHKGSNNCKSGKKIIYQNQVYKSKNLFIKKTNISDHTFYKMLKENKIQYGD